MGVQENPIVYVEVVRQIEKLGGSKGYANNEEAFIKALKQGLSELLPEDDNRAVAVLKHAAKPREIGTHEDEKAGKQRYITFQDWLLGLESLGGSKGFEDFLKENPTGIEPAVSEAEDKEKKDPVRLWQHSADIVECSLVDAAFYSMFNAWSSNGKHFFGSKWSLAAAEVPATFGEMSYNDGMFERTKNATVNITGYGLVADYYNNKGWCGQSICPGGGYISMIVNGSWK
ncbi:hypothetical protein B0H11DRAFT_2285196 [Mycena galericulata]|nr:hypothetical protein B0H11DRAFT_2285196 [Mycena galericulata]